MYSKVAPFLLYAISSLHVGSGSKIGVVDLPIQRETHTGFPKIESSSLKGSIRSAVRQSIQLRENKDVLEKQLQAVFGSEVRGGGAGENTTASAIAFADARILLFPVRSMKGVFAFVTCPMVIERLNQELSSYQTEGEGVSLLPVPAPNTVTDTSVIDHLSNGSHAVVLQEYTFHVEAAPETSDLGARLQELLEDALGGKSLKDRLLVLPDDDFADFVTLATEVNTRIAIDSDKGTVDGGALWTEENVPPDAVFYSFLFSGQPRMKGAPEIVSAEDVECFVRDETHFPPVCQFGGNSTLGRGLMRRIWMEGKKR